MVWIIGSISSIVGLFFIYRSYKNLKTGSVSDTKRYILEIMGYDKVNSNFTTKLFNIIVRNVDSINEMVSKSPSNDANNKYLQQIKTLGKSNQGLLSNCIQASLKINDIMSKYQSILIFNIVYKGDPKVNDDEYNIESAQKEVEDSIKGIVQKHTKTLTENNSLLLNGCQNKTVSTALDNIMEEIKSDILSNEGKNEEIKNQIDDATQSAKKAINETLSNFGLLGNHINALKEDILLKENKKGKTKSKITDKTKNLEKIEKILDSNLPINNSDIEKNTLSNKNEKEETEGELVGETKEIERIIDSNLPINNSDIEKNTSLNKNGETKNDINNVPELSEKKYQYEALLNMGNSLQFEELSRANLYKSSHISSIYRYLCGVHK